jgi:hypothetical protein
VAKFDDLVFSMGVEGLLHHGARMKFPNGYGASVIFSELINIHDEGIFELAVLKKDDKGEWELCYDTPITGDVIPNLTPQGVEELLNRIEAL